jgi:hypothetical protein
MSLELVFVVVNERQLAGVFFFTLYLCLQYLNTNKIAIVICKVTWDIFVKYAYFGGVCLPFFILTSVEITLKTEEGTSRRFS